MVRLGSRIGQARADVLGFQIRIISENLRLGRAAGEHFQYILDPNAHPANARPAAALLGVESDAIKVFHGSDHKGSLPQAQVRLPSATAPAFSFEKGLALPAVSLEYDMLSSPSPRGLELARREAIEQRLTESRLERAHLGETIKNLFDLLDAAKSEEVNAAQVAYMDRILNGPRMEPSFTSQPP